MTAVERIAAAPTQATPALFAALETALRDGGCAACTAPDPILCSNSPREFAGGEYICENLGGGDLRLRELRVIDLDDLSSLSFDAVLPAPFVGRRFGA